MSYEPLSKPDEPLMSDEDDYGLQPTERKCTRFKFKPGTCWLVAFAIVGSVVLFGIGVLVGKNWPAKQHGLLAPAGNVKVWMAANDTFSLRPSPETDALWDSLFPESKGFVWHEDISPEPSALVVYHNLHCLDSLRGMYYAALDGKLSKTRSEHSHHLLKSEHIRHCLDYIRQSIICSADTNLEPVDMEELKNTGDATVTGWGFSRSCRDIKSVRAWAEEHGVFKVLKPLKKDKAAGH